MFLSMIHQAHKLCHKAPLHNHHSLNQEKGNVEFNQESKDSHRQEILLFKIVFVLKNIHKSFANL
jgi:hypothetical protein